MVSSRGGGGVRENDVRGATPGLWRFSPRCRKRPAVSEHNAKYGWPHRRLRARAARDVKAGRAVCARCGLMIVPGEAFDLDHDDAHPGRYLGPSHRRCNRRTAAHRAARRRAQAVGPDDPAPERWSRHWSVGSGYDPRCPHCRDGVPCDAATRELQPKEAALNAD